MVTGTEAVTGAVMGGLAIASTAIPIMAMGTVVRQARELGEVGRGRAPRRRRGSLQGGISDIILGSPPKRRVTKRHRRRRK